MRLGAPLPDADTPERWATGARAAGYRAVYCPVGPEADDGVVRAYAEAARKADLVIAEVGAWSNPLSPDPSERAAAKAKCVASLELAERIGARCCVNIAGSRGPKWDGPFAGDLTRETFHLIVETVRGIVDAVEPKRTFYTLETMPWMYPDTTDSYLEMLEAIDRPAVAVHFDPVNLVSSPQLFFGNARLVADFVARLGGRIRSVHLKDIRLDTRLTVHLDEVRPGLGGMDYASMLRSLDGLDPDLPVMLEHLPDAGEYAAAAGYVRSVAAATGVRV